jgi:sugar phosphate permease
MTVETVHTPENGYRWTVLLLAWLSSMSVYMVRMAVSPHSPIIVGDLRLTLTEVGLLTSASATGYMLAQIPAGWLVDKMGVKRMLFVGTFTAGVFALGIFFAQSFAAVTVILFLSGLGSGCFPTVAMKAVMQWFQMRERGTAIGVNQTSMNIAGIITASTLPALAAFAGWRVGFIATGVFSIILAVLVYTLYREPTKEMNQNISKSVNGASWKKMREVL